MTKIQKNKLIKQEILELTDITKNVQEDKKPFVNRLIDQAAFMFATLKELQETLNTDGAIELFEQGKQKMLREHPAAKTYNTMIKNYSAVIKQLSDITPQGEEKKDPLMEFIEKCKK